MRSINDDILYDIDNSINNEKAKHRIKQEREKLDYEKQYYIKEIERLHSIIKEVREYIEKHIAVFKGGDILVDMNIDELLEILDKVD